MIKCKFEADFDTAEDLARALSTLVEPIQATGHDQAQIFELNRRVEEKERTIASLKAEAQRSSVFDHGGIKSVDRNALRNLLTACAAGNKISAIKEIRSMTGLGLKEAKDLYEESYQFPQSPRSTG